MNRPVSVLLVALVAASFTVAAAKDNGGGPLTKSQCEKLDALWWQAEDLLQQNGPCSKRPGPGRDKCLAIRYELLTYQIEVEQAMDDGQCDRFPL